MSEEIKEEKKAGPADEAKHLEKMTVVELREIAKEIPGVEGVTGMKKEKLLEIIKKDRGIVDHVPGEKKAIAIIALTVDQMKHKIIALKEEKKASIGKHDRKTANILRRRINRLKKSIRKTEKAA
jgi:hypothetical protein